MMLFQLAIQSGHFLDDAVNYCLAPPTYVGQLYLHHCQEGDHTVLQHSEGGGKWGEGERGREGEGIGGGRCKKVRERGGRSEDGRSKYVREGGGGK